MQQQWLVMQQQMQQQVQQVLAAQPQGWIQPAAG